jgi:hypothetical protein
MARFITRVELHGAVHGDKSYDTLHTAMEDEGFSRTITSDDDVEYHLPTAEYYIETDLTIKDVLSSAKTAANKTGKKYGIFTGEQLRSRWHNLKQV